MQPQVIVWLDVFGLGKVGRLLTQVFTLFCNDPSFQRRTVEEYMGSHNCDFLTIQVYTNLFVFDSCFKTEY